MPYTHFQYIAYQVPTVTRTALYPNGNVIYGIPTTSAVAAPVPPLRGNVAALGADATNRINRFVRAMSEAQNLVQAGDNNQTLKIFMAPEFYFRPDNAEFSYTYTQYQAIKDVLRSTLLADLRFKHWLTIPGTIMWKWDQTSPKRLNTPILMDVYFNSAIYLPAHGDDLLVFSRVVEKAVASSIDGIPTGRHGGTAPDDPFKKSTNEMWPKYQSQAKKAKHIFTVGGINCGLDICLEHGYRPPGPGQYDVRVVKHVVNQNPISAIKLHLLTAGGMGVITGSVAAVPNGYILRTDGYAYGGSKTDCKKVNHYLDVAGDPTFQDDLNGTANLTDVAVAHTIPMNAGHALHIPNPPGGDATQWNDHPQEIKIYQRQPIP